MKILNENSKDDMVDLVKQFIPKDNTLVKQVSVELNKMGASIWSFKKVTATLDGQSLEIQNSGKTIDIALNIWDAKNIFKKRNAIEIVYTEFAITLSF